MNKKLSFALLFPPLLPLALLDLFSEFHLVCLLRSNQRFGRGSYKELHGIFRRKHEDGDTFHYAERESEELGERGEEVAEGERREVWEMLRFVVFDCPVVSEEVRRGEEGGSEEQKKEEEMEMEYEKRFARIVMETSLNAHCLIVSLLPLYLFFPLFFFLFSDHFSYTCSSSR